MGLECVGPDGELRASGRAVWPCTDQHSKRLNPLQLLVSDGLTLANALRRVRWQAATVCCSWWWCCLFVCLFVGFLFFVALISPASRTGTSAETLAAAFAWQEDGTAPLNRFVNSKNVNLFTYEYVQTQERLITCAKTI